MHPFSAPWNIRNLTIFWYFQGLEKEYFGIEWVNYIHTCKYFLNYMLFTLSTQESSVFIYSYDDKVI